MTGNGFVARTLVGFSRALSHALTAEQTAREAGLLQSLDPRVRVAGMFALVVAVTLVHRMDALAIAFCGACLVAVASRVSLATLVKRVWLVVLGFTGVIAFPALFLTPGDLLPGYAGETLRITSQGLNTAGLLLLRVETAVTLTTTLVLCTPWAQLLKALRAFHVPKEAVMMLGMAHRYIFLLVETASQMFEARQSRSVGELPGPEQRRMVARTAGVLMSKSMDLSQEVFLAMQSRGYRGEVRTLPEFAMGAGDYGALIAFLAGAAILVWFGRR